MNSPGTSITDSVTCYTHSPFEGVILRYWLSPLLKAKVTMFNITLKVWKRTVCVSTYYIEAKWPKATIFSPLTKNKRYHVCQEDKWSCITKRHDNLKTIQRDTEVKKMRYELRKRLQELLVFLITHALCMVSVWVCDQLKVETSWLYETISMWTFTMNCCIRYCLCHCYLPKQI